MIILKGLLLSFLLPVSFSGEGCLCAVLVAGCVTLCLCICWLSCGSRMEKQLFSRDVSSGESRPWAVARRTGTKERSPREQMGQPMPGLASQQLPHPKTFWPLSLEFPSPHLLFALSTCFSILPFLAHFLSSFSCMCLPHGGCYLIWFPYD